MNSCPYTVSPNTRISQVFNLFRTMGLRHLPVVNAVGEVSSYGSKFLKSSRIKADTKFFMQMFLIMTRQGKAYIKTLWCFPPTCSGLYCVRPNSFLLSPNVFQIVGIITRHNLTQEFLVAKLRQHYITIWSDLVLSLCLCPFRLACRLFQRHTGYSQPCTHLLRSSRNSTWNHVVS